MGTATFDICQSGSFNKNVRGAFVTSGAHTTSTTASSLTDGVAGGGSAVDAKAGDVLTIVVDEPARLRFGDGNIATATAGILLTADVAEFIEISHPGAISIVDIA